MATACGGGSDDLDASLALEGDDGSAAALAASASVFADPAGRLCAKRNSAGVCAQPTSSSTTLAGLIEEFSKPNGARIAFSWSGHRLFTYTEALDSTLVKSRMAYDYESKSYIAGRNAFVMEGQTHRFKAILPIGIRQFVGRDGAIEVYDAWERETLRFQQGEAGGFGTVTPEGGHLRTKLSGWQWFSWIALPTDRNDAPKEAKLVYKGFVVVLAGDSRLLRREVTNTTTANCPVTLTLDTRSGALAASRVSCRNQGEQTSLRFELPPLKVRQSRVEVAAPAAKAVAQLRGPAHGSDGTLPLSFDFDVAEMGGAVFSRQARLLTVSGASKGGMFEIVAERR